MNGEELRYGNYVYSHRANGEKVIHQHFDFSDDVEGYEPIPITKEWLVKFGCWNTPINENLFSCGILSLYLEDDGDVTVSRIENVNNGCYLTTLKYVHQLQNLFFAITGEELELTEKSAEL